MKLYDRFSDRGFHTSIVTTFGIDFDVYENAVLTKLRGSGCYNNILIADSRMLTLALSDGYAMPLSAGKEYTVLGNDPAKGVFHPKILLQLGRQGGQLIVSSANMTAPGIAGNLEIVGHVTCGIEESGERQLISAAWKYVARLLQDDERALDQHNWILDRTPWLSEQKESPLITLADGHPVAFLGTDSQQSIFARFHNIVGSEKVKRLVVMSPYWDEDLSTLQMFIKNWSPNEIIVLIESGRGLFPTDKIPDRVKLIDLQEFKGGRFVHAKALIAETDAADHVLYGSPNCTFAALGNLQTTGRNEEACFYRRMLPDTALSSLELKSHIVDSTPLSPSAIKPFVHRENIDLDYATKSFPGRFQCHYDILTWQPPAAVDIESSKIILLNNNGLAIPATCTVTENKGGVISYKISGTKERISFVRVAYGDGTVSTPAIVLSTDHLRNEALRESRTKKIDEILGNLGGDEEEVLFDLHEIIGDLEIEESKNRQNMNTLLKRAQPEQVDKKYQILDYESFIASRQAPDDHTSARRGNSLQGSSFSEVRRYLNRFLALDSDSSEENSLTDQEIEKAMSVQEESIDGSENNDQPKTLSSMDVSVAPASKKRNENRKHFSDAAQEFIEKIGQKSGQGGITEVDLLRLRSILMIAAALSWSKDETTTVKTTADAISWPRITGRILFGFFGGKTPAIHSLKTDSFYNSIPTDYIECWATCIWAIHSCIIRASAEKESALIVSGLMKLLDNIYLLTMLRKEELLSPAVMDILRGMDRRFSNRLKIQDHLIIQRHLENTNCLSSLKTVTNV